MVECSPGPEGGVALEKGQKRTGVPLHGTIPASPAPECKQPPKHRPSAAHHFGLPTNAFASYPATFIRSNSDGALVSPLPSMINVHSVEEFTNKKFAKLDQKRGVASADAQGMHQSIETCKFAQDSDTFLSASMQLMHLNGEARQRLRQLWTSVQRLGRENQISEVGMDLLYVELGNTFKSMSAEKLEATKYLKSGRLVLLASSPASDPGTVGGGAAVKALFGSRPTAKLMQCSLSEDQSKFELTPVQQAAPGGSSSSGTSPTPPLGRFALPTTASLMGMISDAFQEEPTTRVIRLQGCQVRRLVPKTPDIATNMDTPNAATLTREATMFHRFQLLVPYKTQMSVPADGVRTDILFPTKAPVPYEAFIFEVPTPTSGSDEAEMDAEAEVDDWVWALDRVCKFQLHRLEHALREAPSVERYRETLQRHFPVCVSLSWLHNRMDQPIL